MAVNLEETEISDGSEITSLKSLTNKDGTPVILGDGSLKEVGFELTETDQAESIEKSINNVKFDRSNIDSIEYTSSDDFFPDIILKSLTEEENHFKKNRDKKIETGNKNLDESKIVDEQDVLDAIELSEDDIGLSSKDKDITNQLIEEINNNQDRIVSLTTKIKLSDIDKNLKDDNLFSDKVKISQQTEEEEVFGVKKSDVFYSIDKKIYSNRAESSLDIKKVKGLKSGILLPFLVIASSIIFLFIAIPILSFIFNKNSKATLDDNYYKDVSILEKISKQKEEEVRLAKQKLEEEKKSLEFERNKIESRINEEYTRAVEEIHREYNKKLDDLLKSGLSKSQIDSLRTQLDSEKQIALARAKKERDLKVIDQMKVMSEKDKTLKDTESKLKQVLENKEYEVSKITLDLQSKLREKDVEKENISLRLKELNENNKKVKEFNQMVNQLINSAIIDFKNNEKDKSLLKLANILKYYESKIDFVNLNEDLKSKMQTDLLMVESITKLINESKLNSSYNEEYIKIVDKYKRISNFYKDAENSYNTKNYQKSNELYSKILKEFDEVNYSYSRIKDIDTKLQNDKALNYYNDAIKNMKDQKYEIALSELSTIIKETPTSDYANMALNDIVNLAETLSTDNKTKESDVKAKEIFNKASEQLKKGQYRDAMTSFNQVITDYPYSSFVRESLKNSVEINNILSNEDFKKLTQSLGEKFKNDYDRFLIAYKNGDYKLARESYIVALKNNFSKYTNDTIDQFVDAENRYIESLVDLNKLSSNKDVLKQLDDLKLKLETQYNNDLKSKDNEYSNKIKDLENKNSELMAKLGDTKAIEDIKKELAKKDENYNKQKIESDKLRDELTALNKKYSDITTKIKSNEDAQEQLKSYYTKLSEKNGELENLQTKNSQLTSELKNLTYRYNDSLKNSDKELAKTNEQLNKQLAELDNKYKNISALYNDSIKNRDKERGSLDKMYRDDLEKEKNKLKEEFAKQLQNLRNDMIVEKEIEKNKKDVEKVDIKNKFVARIIELVDESVTFQFLDPNFVKNVRKGDSLKIVRYISKTNEELDIGMIELTFSDKNSLFARGRIVDLAKNQTIQINDLLKN